MRKPRKKPAPLATLRPLHERLHPTRAEIESEWRLFRSVVPSSSDEVRRRRTAYFYRKQAIAFAGHARHDWTGEMKEFFTVTAKQYLRDYRNALSLRAA